MHDKFLAAGVLCCSRITFLLFDVNTNSRPIRVLQREFFPKLVDLFRMCEDLENMEDLHMMFRLVRGISKYLQFLQPYTFISFVIQFNFDVFHFFAFLLVQFCLTAHRSLIKFLGKNTFWTLLVLLSVGFISFLRFFFFLLQFFCFLSV